MNRLVRKAVVSALVGGSLSAVSAGAMALEKDGSLSSAGPTFAEGSVANFAWDGNNATRSTPTVLGGTSKNLGWAHNSKWLDLHIAEPGNYAIRLIRSNPDQKGFNPAFSLWPVGELPFDFNNCKGHCGDTVDFHGTHSYNQVTAPTAKNASAWMLGNAGLPPSGKPENTLDWTPRPGTGVVTGFVGYANSGPTGWLNGMPINSDTASNDFNLSQDQNPVEAGFVNKAPGGGLGGSTLGAESNACAPEGGGAAALNLYGAAAGHYLLGLGGSCVYGETDPRCPKDNSAYRLEIVKLDHDGPQAFAFTKTPKVRAGARAVLDGSSSFDPVACGLAYEWRQADTTGQAVTLTDADKPQPGFTAPVAAAGRTLSFVLTVRNASGASATSDPVSVAVTTDNDPPTIKIGTPQPGTEKTLYTLTSSANDPNGDGIAAYRWEQTGGPEVVLEKADGRTLTFMAPGASAGAETLSFKLTVTDDFAPNPKSAEATVDVVINDDPTLLDCGAAKASNESLWPANRKFKPIAIGGVTGPNPYGLKITGVISDEPVKDKAAKDRTGPDAKIKKGKATKKKPQAVDTVRLRAERQKSGNGRVYAVNFEASDGVQTCTGAVKVEVPTAPGTNAIDDGQSYVATNKK